MISFFVAGLPIAQGSKRIGRNRATGKAVLIESARGLKPWRKSVAEEAWIAKNLDKQEAADLFDAPIALSLLFLFPRPSSHLRRDGGLAYGTPVYQWSKPDGDKLWRAVGDALSGILYRDDARVVTGIVRKRYIRLGDGGRAGVWVRLWREENDGIVLPAAHQ